MAERDPGPPFDGGVVKSSPSQDFGIIFEFLGMGEIWKGGSGGCDSFWDMAAMERFGGWVTFWVGGNGLVAEGGYFCVLGDILVESGELGVSFA